MVPNFLSVPYFRPFVFLIFLLYRLCSFRKIQSLLAPAAVRKFLLTLVKPDIYSIPCSFFCLLFSARRILASSFFW